jgi:hypothetical protein
MLHAHHRKPLLVALTLLCWLPFDAAWATPAPLSSPHKQIFWGSPADLLDKPICRGKRLAAGLYCRDGRHHIHTNEWHHHVFTNRIKGMGGGYVGVGADQQLTFVAAARAELAWLLDYDPTVVALNRVHKQLILAADSPAAFIELWSKKSKPRVAAILKSASGLSAADRKLLQSTYTSTRRWLQRFFRRVWNSRKHERYHWLHDPAGYAHIKAMFAAGRIRIMGGDLLKDRALVGIGKAARRLGVPIRVVYLSNAEEYWRYTKQYRANISGLYFDKRSVVLRCRTGKKGVRIGRYKYVMQSGLDFQNASSRPTSTASGH